MELVPGKLRDLRQRAFWSRFYTERAPEEIIQWYGTLADIKPLFQYELADTEKFAVGPKVRSGGSGNSPQKKPTRNVSVLNCGFGALELAERLHDDLAIRDICTLHSSEELISGMESRNAQKRPDLKFVVLKCKLADMFKPESMDWVIDRGALDHALMSCAESEVTEVATRHLENALSVLKRNGKLILITLGQDTVLKALVQYLRVDRKLTMRLMFLNLKDNNLNSNLYDPIALVITNSPDTSDPEFPTFSIDYRFTTGDEREKESRAKTATVYQLFKVVKDERRRSYTSAHIIDYHPGNLIFFDLCGKDSTGQEMTYSLSAYDRTYPRFASAEKRSKFLRSLRPTIAILAPQADQHHWLYKTVHGHQRLCERASCRRVICVFLPDFGPLADKPLSPQDTVNKIKEDLTRSLIELAVDKKHPVLLMTQQENFCDERIPVHACESGHAGKILVFDAIVDEDDEEFKEIPEDDLNPNQEHKSPRPSEYRRRTMIFECNPRMAQTEIWYTEENGKTKFDYLHVCHAHHLLLLAGINNLSLRPNPSQPYRAALLGLGGGMLASMLKTIFQDSLDLTSIDLDPAVADIAQKHYGFTVGPLNHLVIGDGCQWIVESRNQPQLDFLIVDINASRSELGSGYEGVSAPPPVFLTSQFLEAAKTRLKDTGILLINSITHQEKGRTRMIEKLKQVFQDIHALKYSEDFNEAIICFKTPRSVDKKTKIEDLTPESTQDIRLVLKEMAQQWPAIGTLIQKTPMYLSEYARFNAALEQF